jgi:hypothetical protein
MEIITPSVIMGGFFMLSENLTPDGPTYKLPVLSISVWFTAEEVSITNDWIPMLSGAKSEFENN